MATEELPSWTRSLPVQGLVILVAVLLFQVLTRGEVTPVIAVAVALGWVAVSWLVDRYRRETD